MNQAKSAAAGVVLAGISTATATISIATSVTTSIANHENTDSRRIVTRQGKKHAVTILAANKPKVATAVANGINKAVASIVKQENSNTTKTYIRRGESYKVTTPAAVKPKFITKAMNVPQKIRTNPNLDQGTVQAVKTTTEVAAIVVSSTKIGISLYNGVKGTKSIACKTSASIASKPIASRPSVSVTKPVASRPSVSVTKPTTSGSTVNATKPITGKGSASLLDDGLGTYGNQGGHHPMAKKAFEGVNEYNPNSAVTISKAKLIEFKVQHTTITGQQNSLYTAYAKTGQSLTMDAMKQIEIKAMTNAGVPLDYATNAVEKAIADLLKSGVTQPIKIPWN